MIRELALVPVAHCCPLLVIPVTRRCRRKSREWYCGCFSGCRRTLQAFGKARASGYIEGQNIIIEYDMRAAV